MAENRKESAKMLEVTWKRGKKPSTIAFFSLERFCYLQL